MKRDMNLIRAIVLHVRQHNRQPDEAPGYTQRDLRYHCWLVFNAQFADGADATLGDEYNARLYTLTWAGHNFADAAANETVWREASKVIAKTSTSVACDALLQILAEISIGRVRKALGT